MIARWGGLDAKGINAQVIASFSPAADACARANGSGHVQGIVALGPALAGDCRMERRVQHILQN